MSITPPATAPERGGDVVPRLLRTGHGYRHRRHRRQPAGPRLACGGPVHRRRHRLRRAARDARPASRPLLTRCSTADLTSHAKGFAFLTIVAATNVVGSAAAIIHGWWGLAWVLWYASLPLWAVLAYSTLIAVVLRADKPGLGAGINGTWFLLTVATESIAVLGALLLGRTDSDALAFLCLAAFALGLVLYLIVMTMVFLRWTFQALEPTEAEPPAWIAAGAVAITVLAGSNLLLARDPITADRTCRPLRRGRRGARLGDRYVLVPVDGRHRRLAAPRPPRPVAVPPVVLGDGLPARHVRRGHLPDARRHRAEGVRMAAASRARHRPRRMDSRRSGAWPTNSSGQPAIGRQSRDHRTDPAGTAPVRYELTATTTSSVHRCATRRFVSSTRAPRAARKVGDFPGRASGAVATVRVVTARRRQPGGGRSGR